MSNDPVTLTLPSDEDAALVVSALRSRAADLRSGAEQARCELSSTVVYGRPWATRLVEAGSRAMREQAEDLEDLASLIEQQSAPQAQDEAMGRVQ